MKKREGGILAWAAAVFLLVGMAAGCSRSEEARYQLNPKQPIIITGRQNRPLTIWCPDSMKQWAWKWESLWTVSAMEM